MPDGKGRESDLQFIRQLQGRSRAQDNGPFNDTFQLPDVPGPGIILQGLHRLLLDRGDLFSQFPGIARYESLDQQRYIFFPLP